MYDIGAATMATKFPQEDDRKQTAISGASEDQLERMIKLIRELRIHEEIPKSLPPYLPPDLQVAPSAPLKYSESVKIISKLLNCYANPVKVKAFLTSVPEFQMPVDIKQTRDCATLE